MAGELFFVTPFDSGRREQYYEALMSVRFPSIETLENQGPWDLMHFKDDCWEVQAQHDWDGDFIYVEGGEA